MKKTYILIALAMVAALTMVSCKDNKKAQNQEPTQEEVQVMKQALADSVLAELDAFADEYVSASANSFTFRGFELTESEKLAKPDYLLDPSVASNLVTKTQKINALAFYLVDYGVRMLYDMPTEEAKEVIAKLAMEVNYPVDTDHLQVSNSLSETTRKHYEKCKENGDLALFWQFHNAFITEVGYIIAHNPEFFYGKMTDEQFQAFVKRTNEKNKAMKELAKYDEEMATVYELFKKTRPFSSDEEKAKAFATRESATRFRIENKDRLIARRNSFLQ